MRLIDADALMAKVQEWLNYVSAQTVEVGETDCETVCEPDPYYVGEENVLNMVMRTLRRMPTVSGWISVKDRLPENTNHVLALCETSPFKKLYKCIAMYVRPHEISEGKYPEDDTCFDYDEDEDEYYLKPGWYEIGRNFGEYGAAVIEDCVTHWMPLPKPPEEVTV